MTQRAHVNPDVLRWARTSLGIDVEDAASRIGVAAGRLEEAEAGGGHLLTMRQAERAASLYDRPVATFFLPEPPAEEPQEAIFRRLPGAPEPPWPPAMAILSRKVRSRQEAAVDLLDALEEDPAWPTLFGELPRDRRDAPSFMREKLSISIEEQASWRDPAGYVPLRHWTDAVEDLGILVMQDGTLEVEEMRGFASLHDEVPAIVVNTQDDPRARVFTLLHELGHLYLAALGVAGEEDVEPWCEGFAGEVLAPTAALEEALASFGGRRGVRAFDELALRFGLTPRAIVVRTRVAGLISQEETDAVLASIAERGPREAGGGGNYYWTALGRIGPAYARLVFSALESQAVTYPVASNLLGVKVNNFPTLRTYLDRRSEMA